MGRRKKKNQRGDERRFGAVHHHLVECSQIVGFHLAGTYLAIDERLGLLRRGNRAESEAEIRRYWDDVLDGAATAVVTMFRILGPRRAPGWRGFALWEGLITDNPQAISMYRVVARLRILVGVVLKIFTDHERVDAESTLEPKDIPDLIQDYRDEIEETIGTVTASADFFFQTLGVLKDLLEEELLAVDSTTAVYKQLAGPVKKK